MSTRHLRSRRSKQAATLAALAISATLVSGCGTDIGFRPGVALTVGDAEVSESEFDDAIEGQCEVLDQVSSVYWARSQIADLTAQTVALREIANQLSQEYDVEAGDYYEGARAQIAQDLSAAGADETVLERAMTELSAGDYFVDIVTQIGQEQLGAEADPTDQQALLTAGLEVATEWEQDHPISTDPRYATPVISAEGIELVSQELSVPVSALAQGSADDDPASTQRQKLAAELPASQRCGGAEAQAGAAPPQ